MQSFLFIIFLSIVLDVEVFGKPLGQYEDVPRTTKIGCIHHFFFNILLKKTRDMPLFGTQLLFYFSICFILLSALNFSKSSHALMLWVRTKTAWKQKESALLWFVNENKGQKYKFVRGFRKCLKMQVIKRRKSHQCIIN